MITLSLGLFIASAVIWFRRSEPRTWPSVHVVVTILFVQAAWGVTWMFYGLNFWNGVIAPMPLVLEMSVKLLPFLLKML